MYNESHVFIVCFAIDRRDSLVSACDKWLKEIEALAPDKVTRVLCGTKLDIREILGNSPELVSE